jgi:uncharacterized protein (DUF302 family)
MKGGIWMAVKQKYGMQTRLALPYEQAIEQVTAALKDEGFGVLTKIDVRQTLREKLDKDFRKYIILGACNPGLSYQAFTAELEIGLLLPCNVIVYEDDGESVVSILDPAQMLSMAGNSAVEPVANQAKEKLQRVLDSLTGK